MTPTEASAARQALTSYEDHDTATATLLQLSSDLQCLHQAMFNGMAEGLVMNVLQGIINRVQAAIELAEIIDETEPEEAEVTS